MPSETLDHAKQESWDEVPLEGLRDRLEAVPGDMLVVLHQKGSHGPAYHLRVPPAFQQFQPVCTSDDLQDCPVGQVVNACDNTILHTDHVLAQVVQLLGQLSAERDTAMLYVSDHGESLGENGVFLHGLPFWMAPDAQTRVPLIVWTSPGSCCSPAASADLHRTPTNLARSAILRSPGSACG